MLSADHVRRPGFPGVALVLELVGAAIADNCALMVECKAKHDLGAP